MSDQLIVLTNDNPLEEHEGLMTRFGFEDEPTDQNARYFAPRGDFWHDSDYVRVDNEELLFGIAEPYLILNFSPESYPAHIQFIQDWWTAYQNCPNYDQRYWNQSDIPFTREEFATWKTFRSAPNAIAFRGGSGYVYGIYLKK